METERSYESFARVYDELMDNVPYEKWAARILQVLREQGIEGGLALELGCGTGKMMLQLKGKLTLSQTLNVVRVEKPAAFADVIDSLASMGYEKRLVEQKVAVLAETLNADPAFASKSQKEKEDLIFRRAIVELA